MSRFLLTGAAAVDLAAVEVVTWTMAQGGLSAEVHFIVGNGTHYEVAVTPAEGLDTDEQRAASVVARRDQWLRDWRAAREGKR